MTLKDTFIKSLLKSDKDIPGFKPGDSVRVTSKIFEAGVERLQHFEGVVIGRHGKDLDETFIVRKISFGVGVERIFPFHSPNIEKIELIRRGKVRRVKLYYLRKLIGKESIVKELTP
jgi:large subunit ribosomal protein L19